MNNAVKSKSKYKTRFWLLMTILIASAPGFFRYMVGLDYETYYLVGERIISTNTLEYALSCWGRLEPSFGLLVYYLGKVGASANVAIGLYAILTQFFMVVGIWKYRRDVNSTVAFFVYMSTFYFRTYNMFRQALAMSIILYGIHYLRDKKYLKFIICVIGATFIHRAAIISILMIWYFRPRKKGHKWINTLISYIIPIVMAVGFEYLMRLIQYIPIFSVYVTSTSIYMTFRNESIISLGTLLLIIEITLYIFHRLKYREYENQNLFESILDKAMLFQVIYFILDVIVGYAARIVLFYSVSSIISLSSLYNTKKSLAGIGHTKARKMTIYQIFIIAYCIAQFVRIMLNNGYGQLPLNFWY